MERLDLLHQLEEDIRAAPLEGASVLDLEAVDRPAPEASGEGG